MFYPVPNDMSTQLEVKEEDEYSQNVKDDDEYSDNF